MKYLQEQAAAVLHAVGSTALREGTRQLGGPPVPLRPPRTHHLPAALKRSWFSRDLAVNTSPTLGKWDSEGLILNGRPPPGAPHLTPRAPHVRGTHPPVVRDEALPQAQLPEDVHHNLHGCVVCHGERAHVQDAAELQRPGALGRQGRGVLREAHTRAAHNPLLLFPGTFYRDREDHPLHTDRAPSVLIVTCLFTALTNISFRPLHFFLSS